MATRLKVGLSFRELNKVELFDLLGFRWKRSDVPNFIPKHSIERVCFRYHRMLAEFVWDASVLEGNPFTFPEVQTLLDGVTVGGRRISDQEQVIDLINGSKRLLSMVRNGEFAVVPAVLQRVTTLDEHPFEKAAATFLYGALHQIFFNGNRCFLMNLILMSNGIDAISVPATKAKAFTEAMVRFHTTKDATEMMVFLVDCHPDAEHIYAANSK